MRVYQIPVGTMANFDYLVVDEESREGLAVDSGWETAPVVKAAKEAGVSVKYVVATHEHFDHTATIGELAGELKAKVVAHRDSPIESDLRVVDGEVLKVGSGQIRVIHTPGHTEDSICLYDGRSVFTGDTLFVGTIGKYDRASSEAMFHSLYEVLGKLPATTEMYPGHDYGEVAHRTLGEERKANPFLLAADLRSFLSLFG